MSKPKIPGLDSTSNSKYKELKELSSLIRRGRREAYPGIPQITQTIEVEDNLGPASIEPDGLDWLELSLLVMNNHIKLPVKTQLTLLSIGVYIPETQEMH